MPALAQAADPAVVPTPAATMGDGIDSNPILSPRAEGMGGSETPLADDRDAAFLNPAGIGGTRVDRKNASIVRKFNFPWISVAANKNSRALYNDMRTEGGINDSAVGKAIVDAQGGERQYARANAGLGIVLGRVMILPFTDLQMAATPRGGGSDQIDLREVSTNGIGVGFSLTDAQERFSFGYFGYAASRSDLKGTFAYEDLSDVQRRKQVIKDNTTAYSGIGQNIGVNWRMGKTASPTLGIAMQDVGDTAFRAKTTGASTVVQKQSLSAGFAVSPMIGKWGTLNVTTGADRLLASEVSLVKKYHLGCELTSANGAGSYTSFAVRAGYNDAGASGGASLNLGLIGFDAGLNSVDIGVDNEKVIEHRYVGTIYVNIADF